jgi:predicted aspartyl protease
MRSVSQFTMQVRVENQCVKAIVDTAAQVTIISDRVYNSLNKKPIKLRDVKLLTAGREMAMEGFVAGPIKIKIGDKWYKENVYVAPIEQEMLLGFDILVNRGQAILDMGRGVLIFDGRQIILDVGSGGDTPTVARVTVAKRLVIPPQSVARVKCHIDKTLSDYYIEPVEQSKFLVPRIVREVGSEPIRCQLNPSDRYRVVNKGADLGRAYPADIIEDTETVSVEQVTENLPRATLPNVAPKNVNPEGKATMPPHLQQVFAESCKQLNEDQSLRLAQLLIEFQDVFAADEFDLGNFTAIEHQIDTGNARPVKQRIRRTPVCFAGEEEAHLQKMLKAGVIQESTSDWASAPVLIRKRDGSVRWCIDYRALNEVTVKDLFPLPLVDDCLDTLAGSVWFSKLDANSAYWQIRIKEEDRKKTAFITKYGLFEHVRMGFGLTGAPATYARTMNLVLRGLTWKTVLAFLDDILIMGTSFDDHLVNLREALLRFREYGLKLKPKKCTFFQREVEFLGRKVSGNSISMSDIDIKVVHDWPVPTCAKEVERFMGLVNYHRGFIKDFSEIAVPLYAITGKQPFVWGEEQTKAFETLKKALSNPPCWLCLTKRTCLSWIQMPQI